MFCKFQKIPWKTTVLENYFSKVRDLHLTILLKQEARRGEEGWAVLNYIFETLVTNNALTI